MNKLISRELLYDEYINKQKSMNQIAKEQNIAVGTVYNYIKKYEIESRKHLTEEAKRKIGNANKGNSYSKGKHLSKETKEKIRKARTGNYSKPSKYGGHIKKRQDGYNAVYCPDHPKANKDCLVMEHDLVMEEHIGRYLEPGEVVHHINKVRNDNRIENLKLMTNREHARLHMLERQRKRRELMTYQ